MHCYVHSCLQFVFVDSLYRYWELSLNEKKSTPLLLFIHGAAFAGSWVVASGVIVILVYADNAVLEKLIFFSFHPNFIDDRAKSEGVSRAGMWLLNGNDSMT